MGPSYTYWAIQPSLPQHLAPTAVKLIPYGISHSKVQQGAGLEASLQRAPARSRHSRHAASADTVVRCPTPSAPVTQASSAAPGPVGEAAVEGPAEPARLHAPKHQSTSHEQHYESVHGLSPFVLSLLANSCIVSRHEWLSDGPVVLSPCVHASGNQYRSCQPHIRRSATPAAVERANALWRQLESRKRTIAAQMGELEALEDTNAF